MGVVERIRVEPVGMGNLSHDALAHDLAGYLHRRYQRVTWENITFDTSDGGGRRPDVFSIVPTLNPLNFRPWSFEVKVNRADWLGELKSGKWKHHQRYSQRFYFACPEGLIAPDECPSQAGLIVRKASWEGWLVIKLSKINKAWALTPRDHARLILGRWADRHHCA